ncbi:MAG: hypothetical protein NT154_39330 [Verrucomicrobia bacterium]|nr:hypothetical protein [Verrucomicrobiota bacterium]
MKANTFNLLGWAAISGISCRASAPEQPAQLFLQNMNTPVPQQTHDNSTADRAAPPQSTNPAPEPDDVDNAVTSSSTRWDTYHPVRGGAL